MDNIYWLAGLLEGAGSFVWHNNNQVVIQCTIIDEDVIADIHQHYGGNIHKRIPKNSNHSVGWIWRLLGNKAIQLMKELLPLMEKRRASQIRTVLALHDQHQESLAKKRKTYSEKRAKAVLAYSSGEGTLRALAAQYGVSTSTILTHSKKLK